MSSISSITASRDYRADLFRGIALLTIFANHFSSSALHTEWAVFKLTPSNFLYFSGAETFVFISGLVFGIVYKKVYRRNGWSGCYQKALWRAWELYVANAATLLVTLAACAVFFTTWDLDPSQFFPAVASFFAAPLQSLPAIVGMHQGLRYFAILNLYIYLLISVPLFLSLVRRSAAATAGLSLIVYALAVAGVAEGIGAGFNVFQWQFHFVMGLLLGWYQPSVSRSRWMEVIAGAFLVVGALDRYLLPRIANLGLLSPDSLLLTPLPLEGKGGPLAALQFAAALYLVVVYFPRAGSLYERTWVRPVVVTGQHALPVFCIGIFLCYVGGLLTRTAVTGAFSTLLLLWVGLALSVATAYAVRSRRRMSKKPPPVTAADPHRRVREVA
jgi:hypothetical protein